MDGQTIKSEWWHDTYFYYFSIFLLKLKLFSFQQICRYTCCIHQAQYSCTPRYRVLLKCLEMRTFVLLGQTLDYFLRYNEQVKHELHIS